MKRKKLHRQGHRTWLTRAVWYICAAAALGVFIASLPGYFLLVPQGFAESYRFAFNPAPFVLAANILAGLLSVAATILALSLAWILFSRRSEDRMAVFTSYFLLAYGALVLGPYYVLEAFWPDSFRQIGAVLVLLVMLPLASFLFILFPNGRFVPRWSRWFGFGSLLVAPAIVLTFPGFSLDYSDPGHWISAITGYLIVTIFVFSMLGLQVYRYRNISIRQEQLQTKWVVYGVGVMVGLLAISGIPRAWAYTLPPGSPFPFWGAASQLIYYFALAFLPVTLCISVMRYRLYDIDIIINRTLVYGTLTASVMAIYALSVGILGVLFQAQGNSIIALLATGLIAVLFQPLRERLQAAVNRFYYGQRDDPLLALSQLGKRLEAAIAPDVVLPTLIETIAHTLKLPYVAISLRSGNEFKIAAESGDEVDNDVIRIPLIYQGETVGQLIAGPRGTGESFSQADKQLLESIAYQAGPAAYNVQLTQDLRQSRMLLVTAREEERRRLRRDLHDGLGPVLASQGLKMAAVSKLLQDNPATAQRLLEELTVQNEMTVAEIRRLVYDLRPAALDDLGLVEAVRDYASGLGVGSQVSPRLQVDVQAPGAGLRSLPAAIEVAAYRIATEALTNVARHARARRAAVSFSLVSANHSQELHLEIADNGIGLTGDHRSGIGLISMRERAEELGGNFIIESSPGQGTRVIADLPLAKVE